MTDYYGDGRSRSVSIPSVIPTEPAWTAGPAGWLTLLRTQQLIVLLTQLPGSRSDGQMGAPNDQADVCPLIRNEIWQREWSSD